MERRELWSESCRHASAGMTPICGFPRPTSWNLDGFRWIAGALVRAGAPKPGVSMAQAAADLTAVVNRLAKSRPQDYPAQFQVLVAQIGHSVAGHFESTLYTILVAVGLLLLICCVNVANLMLARATAREKEFVLRAMLGAGTARLVRLLLVESLVLTIGGAALGVVIAWGGRKRLSSRCRQI
jgi:ABC-type antimicrobial peptide transport system permease subunit